MARWNHKISLPSGTKLPQTPRFNQLWKRYQMLADVFDLCKLARKRRGGQRKLFGISAEVQKALADRDLRLLQREKSISMSRADAVEKIASFYGLDVCTLANWVDGRTGASRRQRERIARHIR
jgi:hypothetical protein